FARRSARDHHRGNHLRHRAGPGTRNSRIMTAPLRAGEPVTVNVPLGERAYDIVIGRGLLSSLGRRLKAIRPNVRAAIVTDTTVAPLYLEMAEASLSEAGIASVRIIVPAGEKSKSFRVFERVCEGIIADRIERGDVVVALGGGVVGDLAGFAAAVVRRGLEVAQ